MIGVRTPATEATFGAARPAQVEIPARPAGIQAARCSGDVTVTVASPVAQSPREPHMSGSSKNPL